MHPYKRQPPHAFWPAAVADLEPDAVDPVVSFPFRIEPADRVATAGSCFAQHIARHLRRSCFNYYVTEPGHPVAPPAILKKYSYGAFSARYGNIYTTRHLVQLFERAYGTFTPSEDVWRGNDSRWIDPYRPTVEPGGFTCEAELFADRERHFAAVRQMFENSDYFVFTLGLTECWYSRRDGAVFPMCPGVAGGVFDSAEHGFLNLSVVDVVADLEAFVALVGRVNPRMKIILTVSPVPLMATAEARHVLTSTIASKSILRSAADAVERRFENVAYFPSYEIVTGAFTRGRYFAADLRSVTEEGVEHVMRLFLRHATTRSMADSQNRSDPLDSGDAAYMDQASRVAEVICDEELLGRMM